MADSTNRAVNGAVVRTGAVYDAVHGAVWGAVHWAVWRAVDEAGGRTATRNVRRVVVDAAPRANHPALQDFLKGVKLQ